MFLPDIRAMTKRAEESKELLKNAKSWDPKMKFEKKLALKADSYKVDDLFPELSPVDFTYADASDIHREHPEKVALSPRGGWLYMKKTLPARGRIETINGSKKGFVMFDGEVFIPTLYQHLHDGWFSDTPLMSLTPMEMFTLRPGTRKAKGHTVVCGLGLGYQLKEVMEKKSVQKVTLIEKSGELLDWVIPRLRLPNKAFEIICGDVWEEIQKIKADVLLVDVFESYGGNKEKHWHRLGKAENNFKTIWFWGAANTPRRDYY